LAQKDAVKSVILPPTLRVGFFVISGCLSLLPKLKSFIARKFRNIMVDKK
jgi:hypothetical protein